MNENYFILFFSMWGPQAKATKKKRKENQKRGLILLTFLGEKKKENKKGKKTFCWSYISCTHAGFLGGEPRRARKQRRKNFYTEQNAEKIQKK